MPYGCSRGDYRCSRAPLLAGAPGCYSRLARGTIAPGTKGKSHNNDVPGGSSVHALFRAPRHHGAELPRLSLRRRPRFADDGHRLRPGVPARQADREDEPAHRRDRRRLAHPHAPDRIDHQRRARHRAGGDRAPPQRAQARPVEQPPDRRDRGHAQARRDAAGRGIRGTVRGARRPRARAPARLLRSPAAHREQQGRGPRSEHPARRNRAHERSATARSWSSRSRSTPANPRCASRGRTRP